jgi:hypothetical protein
MAEQACSSCRPSGALIACAYKAGDVLVIRNEGPVGGPGMQKMLGVTALISDTAHNCPALPKAMPSVPGAMS